MKGDKTPPISSPVPMQIPSALAMWRTSTLSDGTVAMNSGNTPVTHHPTTKIAARDQRRSGEVHRGERQDDGDQRRGNREAASANAI